MPRNHRPATCHLCPEAGVSPALLGVVLGESQRTRIGVLAFGGERACRRTPPVLMDDSEASPLAFRTSEFLAAVAPTGSKGGRRLGGARRGRDGLPRAETGAPRPSPSAGPARA